MNDKGHQIEHIKYVINRYYKLSKNIDVDNNILYVIVAYYDIYLNKIFSNDNLIIMKEAIEDHGASLDREPRNIYGKILSSADRNIDVDDSLKRTYLYSITHFNKHSEKETIE